MDFEVVITSKWTQRAGANSKKNQLEEMKPE